MVSVTSYLSKLIYGEPETPPSISIETAAVLLVVYALAYFVPFYLSSWTRPSATISRDAPSVIRARIASVTFSCAVCSAATYVVLLRHPRSSAADALHLMGLWPVDLRASLAVLVLTALLFAGPLFAYIVVDGGWQDWARLRPLKEVWSEWTVWRNLVAGPVTEEVLFRCASVPLMLVARASVTQTIFLSPLIFGLAHFHHFYEFRLTNPGASITAAAARSLFQLAYTTVFGAYATFLYVRTASLLGVCLVHTFCNCMGLPRLWGRVEPASDADGGKEGLGRGGGSKTSIVWTIVYYVLLVLGAVLWYRNLWSLTESSLGLMPTEAFFRTAEKRNLWWPS